VVEKDDTCNTLAAMANATNTQIIAWNLNINPSCRSVVSCSIYLATQTNKYQQSE